MPFGLIFEIRYFLMVGAILRAYTDLKIKQLNTTAILLKNIRSFHFSL